MGTGVSVSPGHQGPSGPKGDKGEVGPPGAPGEAALGGPGPRCRPTLLEGGSKVTAGQVSVTPVPRGRAGLQGVPPRGPRHRDRVGKGPLREPEVPRRCGVRCSEATATSDGEEEDGVGTVQETAGEARDGPPEGPARPGTGAARDRNGRSAPRRAGMKTPPPGAPPRVRVGSQAARPQGRNGARNGTFATIRTRRRGGNAPNLYAPNNVGSKRRKQTSW